MQKLISLTAGVAVMLTGCQSAKTTQTWNTVKSVRHVAPGVPDRDRAYAAELHKTLQKAGVEHKVVTFTFRHTTRLRAEQIVEGTAVVYRDSGTPSHPWWFMAEHLFNPVWLPTASLQRQIGFYLVRPATITKVEEFSNHPATEPARRRAPVRYIARRPAPVSPRIAQPTVGNLRPEAPRQPLVTTLESGPEGSTIRSEALRDPKPIK